MQLPAKRALSIASASAVLLALIVAAPSIAACYWQNTGGDSWILVVDETGQCVIGGPPGSAEAQPTPSPSASNEPAMPSGGDDGGRPEPEPTASATPTPTPTPTATPEAVVEANPWLKTETPTVKAVETRTVQTVTLRTLNGVAQSLVIASDDGGVSNTCDYASACSIRVPNGSEYSWLVFNPTHFTVPNVPTLASSGNIYVAGGSGVAANDVTVEATLATGDKAKRPLDLSRIPSTTGVTRSLDATVSIKVPKSAGAISLPFLIGPSAAPPVFVDLPQGLTFDPVTGILSGQAPADTQFVAKLQVDLLEVTFIFTVGFATFQLVFDQSALEIWHSIYSTGKIFSCETASCEFSIPLTEEFTVSTSSWSQLFKLDVTVPTGYVLSGKVDPIEADDNAWRSYSRLSIAKSEQSIGNELGAVTIKVVPVGERGSPEQVVITPTTGEEFISNVDALTFWTVPAGPVQIGVRKHPQAGGGTPTITSCRSLGETPIPVTGGKAVVNVTVNQYTSVYCSATNASEELWIMLYGGAPALLPVFTPTTVVEGQSVTSTFPSLASSFPNLSRDAISQRVPSYHINLAFSTNGETYVDVLDIDPPISTTGFKISSLPVGLYRLDISRNDKLLGRTAPIRTSFRVAGGGTAYVVNGVLNGFSNAKIELMQP